MPAGVPLGGRTVTQTGCTRRWRNERVHPIRRVEHKGLAAQTRAGFKPMSAAEGLVLLHVSSYQGLAPTVPGEPIADEAVKRDVGRAVKETEHVFNVDFW